MKNRKPRRVTPEQLAALIEEGVTLLASGKFAPPWICREVLSLDGKPVENDVFKAVHRALHLNGEDLRWPVANRKKAAIIAAALLFMAGGAPVGR